MPDAERFSAAALCDRIVQVEDIDPPEAQPREAALERLRYGFANAPEVRARQADLCTDGHVGRFELLQHTAEILFRFAVAVLHCGVEIVHAGLDRPRHGALLVKRIAAHHQSADRAAAEAQHRELHSSAPEHPHVHGRSSARQPPSRDIQNYSLKCALIPSPTRPVGNNSGHPVSR